MSNQQVGVFEGVEKVIIGIDFGTTYSGVAYVFTAKPSEVYLIKEWAGAKGITYEKCPTLLKYEQDGSVRWGFELERTTEGRIEAFKLLLDPDQPTPTYIPALDTNVDPTRLGKAPITVATDYIREVFKHATNKIESKYPEGYFQTLKKEYVLTVPALWSDKAQNATLKAAWNAGITPIKLIKEPEAAALSTLRHMADKGLEVGDAFVICDAGGGTVDLISYEIVSLKPFKLKELVKPRGCLAGSLMLNRRFEDYIKSIVGEDEFVRLRETGAYARAMKNFDDHIKQEFYHCEDDEQYVNFPRAGLKDRPEKGLLHNTITIKRATLYEIFDPIILDIDRLIFDQISQVRLKRGRENHLKGQDIAAIFLVGGFGASSYLCAKITSRHPDIRVIQPNDAWSAIVRGAVMFSLSNEASVVSNIARKHYGVRGMSYDIDRIKDANEQRYFCDIRGKWGVDRMYWYIQQGDDLMRHRPIRWSFNRVYQRIPSSHAELQVESRLQECESAEAPRHPRAGIVRTLCTLNTDLSAIPKKCFKRQRRRGTNGKLFRYWQLDYELVLTIQSGPMLFSLNCDGKEYSSVAVNYQ